MGEYYSFLLSRIRMLSFFRKQWFLVGICCSVLLGYSRPEWGQLIRHYDIISIGIFLSFFLTGLCLETQSILRLVDTVRAPVAASLSSLIIYPIFAWLLAIMLLPPEFVIGVCIFGAGPVTLTSGTIMTAIACGNVPLSILICLVTNILAIITMPLMLNVLLNLGGSIDLPIMKMFTGLVILVFVPLLAGQVLRPFLVNMVRRYEQSFSIFQSCIIILIIFNVVSRSAEHIDAAGTGLLGILLFVVFLYMLMLWINYLIARLIRLDTPSLVAFTLHTSQKTLAVSYVVWAAHFAENFPTAFLPAIVCQLVQMIAGTLVARFFKLRFQHSNYSE